jgi:hypothetical protein
MAMPVAMAASSSTIRFEWFGAAGPRPGEAPRNTMAPGTRWSRYEKSSAPMTGDGMSTVLASPATSRATPSAKVAKPASFTVTG